MSAELGDGYPLCPAWVRPCGLKNVLEAGRHSSHTAARPASQVSAGLERDLYQAGFAAA